MGFTSNWWVQFFSYKSNWISIQSDSIQKNNVSLQQNGWDYSYRNLKTGPFEIQPSKSMDLKCFWISNGQISDPYCILPTRRRVSPLKHLSRIKVIIGPVLNNFKCICYGLNNNNYRILLQGDDSPEKFLVPD